MRSAFTIRPAFVEELELLRDIDDDATALYALHGLQIHLAPDHPFASAELARWARAAELGRAFLAVDEEGSGLAFAALDVVDGAPYLDQLAVRPAAMRRGIGRALLARSEAWARSAASTVIWLTTYDHLPFNRPYYERHGYAVVPESECGEGVRHHLLEQRRVLPAADRRVAMRRVI